ncbi:MAG TPA: chromosome segregation protein ScpA [Cyanobacteria bacterium UBA8156]|nr:chromosome segregation protein ScpA [Cyanobacteria bacterium UBA8156]
MAETAGVAKEAIAVLIDLAEKGEIDPWDINVIDALDRCLERLFDSDRRTLAESAEALLYGAMLVLLKARTLDPPVMVEPEPDIEVAPSGLPLNLETCLRRRPVALPPQHRPVTLLELIAELENLSQQLPDSGPRPPRPRKLSNRAARQAIAQLAHRENLTEMAAALGAFLAEKPETVPFDQLGEQFGDPVGVFWGLLLLSAQSRVVLHQSDFYGKIWVEPIALAHTG